MSGLQERLARLSPAQRAHLMRKLAKQKNPLRVVENRSSLPLSFSQQRLWFLDQFEHGSANYNITLAYRIRGSLDVEVMRRAFNEIVRRHESLRTTFAMQGDAPVQVIAASLELEIPLFETSDEATLHKLIMAEANRIFDLQQGPLLSAQIIRLAREDHAMLFNLHHIISDGWSMGVFLRELNQLYAAFIKGETSPLAEPQLQYADYAVWQRQQGEALAKQLDYWKQKLATPPVLELPTDRPRPPVQRYRGAILRWHVASPLTARLRQLAQQEQVTLFMLLTAVFQTLLYRYSSQEDFTVGSPIAGRNHSELEDMIGLFVNTLVLRADLSGSPTFRQLLARVRETSLAAFSNQDTPFEKLVEDLPERDMSRNPLFQVIFALQNTPSSQLVINGAEVEQIEIPIETGKLDLSLSVTETNQGLACTFNYNTDLFDKATVERMAGHLQNLLQAVVDHPHRPVAELPLLTEEEQRTLLVNWNDTRRDFPTDKTIHALFEEQVQATPDAVALMFGNQQLTYGELNARANQLAHLLIARGIETGQPVALLMHRSMELLISILAILKAGGAYLPLDPKHPWERIQTILDDVAPKLLLTNGGHHESLAGHLNVAVLNIDTMQSELDAADKRNPDTPMSPDNLAYVLYTSGSTGIPKGVMIEHGSVINLACALQTQIFDNFDKRPLRVALNTAITFDASVQQWTRLLWGDCIVILPEEVSHDTQAFVAALRTQHADVLGCSPAQLRLMFDEGLFNDAGNCPAIVLCGGEAIDADLWRLASAQQRSHIYNVYGPTECTVDSTCCLIDAKTNVPHVGRPLANVQAYILDRNHQPVPIGISGELWLGGAGVGRGYLNKPELTASSFIPDPYANASNARLYKTGDLACYLPDGNIEYLGRIDFQVKLRGYRIELGEIESLLRQHDSVKDAVATLREDTPGDQRLAAYVIPLNNSVNSQELMSMLKAKLPEYMVPADIVLLKAFPLTTSGKVDRKSLPVPSHDRSLLVNQFIAPRTPYEKRIARIWGEIMALETPGLHDNFFELGGHSLLATRVVSRINRAFDTQLPLRNIFESPTIAGLSQALVVNKARALQEVALTTLLDQLENLTEAEAEQLFAEKTAGGKS